MKTIVMVLMLLITTINVANAFEPDFFNQYTKEEIRLKYTVGQYRTSEEIIYLLDVDSDNGILIGRTNAGKAYIPIQSVMEVETLGQCQYVHNHED